MVTINFNINDKNYSDLKGETGKAKSSPSPLLVTTDVTENLCSHGHNHDNFESDEVPTPQFSDVEETFNDEISPFPENLMNDSLELDDGHLPIPSDIDGNSEQVIDSAPVPSDIDETAKVKKTKSSKKSSKD